MRPYTKAIRLLPAEKFIVARAHENAAPVDGSKILNFADTIRYVCAMIGGSRAKPARVTILAV